MNPGINADENSVLGGWGRTNYIALLVAGLFALLLPFLLGGQQQFFQAYLFGWVFWTTIALGCLGLTLLHHTVRGAWGLPVLRLFEAGNRTLPLMGLLYLPILLFGMHDVYHHWTDAAEVARDPILRQKSLYLNVPFFAVRFVIYFAIWIGLATYLNRSSLRQDQTGDKRLADQRANLAAPGLVIYVITMTFAFTDWVMSLEPHWFSTIYGVWFVTGAALSTMALVTWFVMRFADRRPYSEVVTPVLMKDLGNLMLALTLFWAYISLSQFLIIWSADLPEEVTFYTKRLAPGWRAIGTFTVLFQFFLPFLLLLSGRTKRTPGYLVLVAGLIFAMRMVDVLWIVVPAFDQPGLSAVPSALLALVGIGAFWISAFVYILSRRALLPTYDPRLTRAMEAQHA
jgi:hypothetical protein